MGRRAEEVRQCGVHLLRPSATVDSELDWFFNRAECDMGNRSNYEAVLGQYAATPRLPAPEDAAEASHAHRTIRGGLKAIADSDAGVLQAAYVMRPWPEKLYDELGRITGVVVRLACARGRWPEDHADQERVEMARAQWLESRCAKGCGRSLAPLQELRRDGEVRFARAHHAYAVVRGARPCLARSS